MNMLEAKSPVEPADSAIAFSGSLSLPLSTCYSPGLILL